MEGESEKPGGVPPRRNEAEIKTKSLVKKGAGIMRVANALTSCLRSREEPQDSEEAAFRSVNTSSLIHPPFPPGF